MISSLPAERLSLVAGTGCAEIELRDSQHRLDAALWGGGIGFWSWERRTGQLTLTDNWLLLAGFTREEWNALGTPWQARVHPDDRPRLLQQLERLREGQAELLEIDYRFQARCGDWIWLLGRARAPERDADGRALRVFGTSVDITAQNEDARVP